MVTIIEMRNNMFTMIAHCFNLFIRNNYFNKINKYQACVLLYMQISCNMEMLKSEHKKVVKFQMVVFNTEKDPL